MNGFDLKMTSMATSPRMIETPTGSKAGSIFEKLTILGVASFLTQTENQSNDQQQWEEFINISVPVGTVAIIASQDYWVLAHGSIRADLNPLDPNSSPQWSSADRPWGLGRASVSVIDVNAPDFTVSPPAQSAQLVVRMNLLDYNGDDPWFGLLGYSLTFFGVAPRTPAASTAVAERVHERIIWHGGKRR